MSKDRYFFHANVRNSRVVPNVHSLVAEVFMGRTCGSLGSVSGGMVRTSHVHVSREGKKEKKEKKEKKDKKEKKEKKAKKSKKTPAMH